MSLLMIGGGLQSCFTDKVLAAGSGPTLLGAWSASRVLRAAWGATGNLRQVRRSTDQTTLDIPATAGWLNVGAMTGFVGADPNDGFDALAYDQSGNGLNLTQATAAVQPKAVWNGTPVAGPNSKWAFGCLNAEATYRFLRHASLTMTQPFTVFTLARLNAGLTRRCLWSAGTATHKTWLIRYDTTMTLQVTYPSNKTINWNAIEPPTAIWLACWSVVNGASSVSRIQGTSVTGNLTGESPAAEFNLGTSFSAYPWEGEIVEAAIFSGALSTAQMQAGEADLNLAGTYNLGI